MSDVVELEEYELLAFGVVEYVELLVGEVVFVDELSIVELVEFERLVESVPVELIVVVVDVLDESDELV
ncbi:hypothetical protein GCM10028803_23300 [Larkinella knui]